jgi:hypothetical protein
MRLKSIVMSAALATITSVSAQAAPITYEGTLTFDVPVTGSVTGTGWETETATGVDFWRFNGIAGLAVSILGTRLNPNLDPVFTLYFGTTTADASQFIHDADWGGLRYLHIADDEVPVAAGPGGDPLLANYMLPFTGAYTIAIGGFNSIGEGPYSYRLLAIVPEPESAVLVLAGLAAFGWLYRRRRRNESA